MNSVRFFDSCSIGNRASQEMELQKLVATVKNP